ncbi:MAG TPA: hypothetical protein VEQ61_06420 [Thermoleophilaceae bacterium]|nr:hypothetical protein [Thermoleophilaceae bacterium]
MFERLDFVYLPSRDAAADVRHYSEALGAEVVFCIERFETRVAMVRLAPEGPALLLAEHLEGDQPILIFRVADLEAAAGELEARGVTLGGRFEMPFGHGIQLEVPGPQRLAVYELTRRERGESITGRRDF